MALLARRLGALAFAISLPACGAARVVKGKVLIGNGGAEFGVRGYLSAYDAKWKSVVREGARASLGMGNFSAMIDDETSEAIRAYVISEANSGRDAEFYRAIAGTETKQ